MKSLVSKNNMESPDLVAIPTTTEGIAIHLGYISKNISDLGKKMDALQNNVVTRDEWIGHLKVDDDHESRIRKLENFGALSIGGLFVLELVLKYLLK